MALTSGEDKLGWKRREFQFSHIGNIHVNQSTGGVEIIQLIQINNTEDKTLDCYCHQFKSTDSYINKRLHLQHAQF